MAEKILTTPISAKDLEDIRIGDILWLDGLITTCRDVAHRRLIDDDRPLPISLSGGAIFHAGPIVRRFPDPKTIRHRHIRSSPSALPPVCAWKNLKKNLSARPVSGSL